MHTYRCLGVRAEVAWLPATLRSSLSAVLLPLLALLRDSALPPSSASASPSVLLLALLAQGAVRIAPDPE